MWAVITLRYWETEGFPAAACRQSSIYLTFATSDVKKQKKKELIFEAHSHSTHTLSEWTHSGCINFFLTYFL